MSHLKYYWYKGFGERQAQNLRYSQAVRVGDRIEIAGQGGVNPETSEFYKDLDEQIDVTFANVDLTLKDAGGKGWSQVFRVTSYHVPLNSEALAIMVRNFEKWMPDHRPIWTAVGVAELGVPDAKVEIEVVAHDPEGSQAAAGSAA